MKLSLIFLIMIIPHFAWSLVTLRGTYTGLVSKDVFSKACEGSSCSSIPKMVPLFGLGADVLFKLPLLPFGFGLRNENLTADNTAQNTEALVKLNRTALLLNYRFIDTIVHFGVVGTHGINHTSNITVKNSGLNAVDYGNGNWATTSFGVEFEVKPLILFPLVVGAEGGYLMAEWSDAKDSVAQIQKNMNLSGTYLKVFVGLDF